MKSCVVEAMGEMPCVEGPEEKKTTHCKSEDLFVGGRMLATCRFGSKVRLGSGTCYISTCW